MSLTSYSVKKIDEKVTLEVHTVLLLRRRIAELLEARRSDDKLSHFFDIVLTILIALNVVAVILESVPELEMRYRAFFKVFEIVSVVLFSIEYILRVWSYIDRPDVTDKSPFWGRLRYMATPYALIDLIAILPSYLALFVSLDLRFLRVIRLLRLLKFTRYSYAMQALLDALRIEAYSLGAALFLLLILFVLASSGIYLLEHQEQPESFGSIPAAMWWAMATLTTVGYGDVVPATTLGKFFGGCITIIGVGMVALPAGIIASGFADRLQQRRTDFNYLFSVLCNSDSSQQDKTEALAMLGQSLRLNEPTQTALQEKLKVD